MGFTDIKKKTRKLQEKHYRLKKFYKNEMATRIYRAGAAWHAARAYAPQERTDRESIALIKMRKWHTPDAVCCSISATR
jgi:hypothetical protein